MSRRERDALVETWIDRRYLATVALIMVKEEIPPVSVSDIVRTAIETVVNISVMKGGIELVQTTEEASRILQRFKVNLNRGDKGKRNLMQNLQTDMNEAEASVGLGMKVGRQQDLTRPVPSDDKVHALTQKSVGDLQMKVEWDEKKEQEKLEELKEMENPTFDDV